MDFSSIMKTFFLENGNKIFSSVLSIDLEKIIDKLLHWVFKKNCFDLDFQIDFFRWFENIWKIFIQHLDEVKFQTVKF